MRFFSLIGLIFIPCFSMSAFSSTENNSDENWTAYHELDADNYLDDKEAWQNMPSSTTRGGFGSPTSFTPRSGGFGGFTPSFGGRGTFNPNFGGRGGFPPGFAGGQGPYTQIAQAGPSDDGIDYEADAIRRHKLRTNLGNPNFWDMIMRMFRRSPAPPTTTPSPATPPTPSPSPSPVAPTDPGGQGGAVGGGGPA